MASSSSSIGKRGKLKKPYMTSAEWVAEDNHIMTEILLRLPAESIIKCKRVSKRIRSLVSSYWFAKKFHELRQKEKKNNPFGLFIYKRPPYRASIYLSLNDTDENRQRARVPGNFPKDKIDILQSCNGLFLCRSPNMSRLRYEAEDKEFFVCNATVKQSVLIMRSSPGWSDKDLCGLALAFDPLRSPVYSVVAIWGFGSGPGRAYSAEVYSSSNRSWRPAKGEVFISRFQGNFRGVYHDGAISWLEWGRRKFISFDLDKECLKSLELPLRPDNDGIVSVSYFGSSGDRLHLMDRYDRQYVVYEMTPDSSEWLIKYAISMDDIHTFSFSDGVHVPLYDLSSLVLSIVSREAEDELALVITLPDKIIYYSPKNKATRLLRDKNGLGSRTFFKNYYPYCMSTYSDVFQYYETIYPVTESFTTTPE